MLPSELGITPMETACQLLRGVITHYELLITKMIMPHKCSPNHTREKYLKDHSDKVVLLSDYKAVLIFLEAVIDGRKKLLKERNKTE